MAATARPDLVDLALLRPGRVDKAVYCNFPSEGERSEIIKVYLRKFNFKTESSESELSDWVKSLASKTKNFTSADLKGLVQNTQLEKMSSVIKQIPSDSKEEEPDFSINEQDID